jgi:hypothetical protein
MKPKPLSCTIDQDGVKHSSFNEREMREYLATTTDTTLLVTTEEGVEFVIVVESLRQALQGG